MEETRNVWENEESFEYRHRRPRRSRQIHRDRPSLADAGQRRRASSNPYGKTAAATRSRSSTPSCSTRCTMSRIRASRSTRRAASSSLTSAGTSSSTRPATLNSQKHGHRRIPRRGRAHGDRRARGVEETPAVTGTFLHARHPSGGGARGTKWISSAIPRRSYRSIVTEFTGISRQNQHLARGVHPREAAWRATTSPSAPSARRIGPTVLREQMDARPQPSPETAPAHAGAGRLQIHRGRRRAPHRGRNARGREVSRAGDKIVVSTPPGKRRSPRSRYFRAHAGDAHRRGRRRLYDDRADLRPPRRDRVLESEEAPSSACGCARGTCSGSARSRALRQRGAISSGCGTAKGVEARGILRVVDASELDSLERRGAEKNEVAEVILRLDQSAAFDTARLRAHAPRRFVHRGRLRDRGRRHRHARRRSPRLR